MIETLREAFIEILDELEWMDAETRSVARNKALAMNERIGYPELLTKSEELVEEYQLLKVTENDFLQNVLNLRRYEAQYNLAKLRQPVAKDKWSTEPAVVNVNILFHQWNLSSFQFVAIVVNHLIMFLLLFFF